ncbi:MAG: cytochrome-c oxidase, cbb3-type subunit I [Devosia sp.]
MTPTLSATADARPVDRPVFEDVAIRLFLIATIVWAILGMLVGVFIAAQLAYPQLNFMEYITFGRARPLHTSAVILGFGGNALIGTSLYVVQRTCQATLYGGRTPSLILFWGYQILILTAGVSYLAGFTQSKEYAEPEWFFDIALTLLWVLYFVVFTGTVFRRKEPHIYVALWFYWAFIIAVAVLHITNNIAIPTSMMSGTSYPVFSGVQSAMVQWWYGHNMVGFFLTAGFIGIMYYFVPKQAGRPIWSYRLSIVHFWSLIFLYIWAGPHHLHYTSLPDWAQTLGVVFSVMLWMPSWGGMVNGIMTLSGAWGKLRTDPIMRFLVVAVAFYGMSTFEGPLLSIKQVNALSHYTDWTVGHVHSGALGWVGFIAFGAVYYLVPRMWKRPLHSEALVEVHFWLASVGILLYITAMWVSGITQGLMWRTYDDQGFLLYSFSDTVAMLHPYYVTRTIGGIFYLVGVLVMAYNLYRTVTAPMTAQTAPPRSAAGLSPAE